MASSSTLRALVLDTYSFILPESTLLLVNLASLSFTSSSLSSVCFELPDFGELDHVLSLAALSLLLVGFVFVFTETPIPTSWASVNFVGFSMGLTSATLDPTLTGVVFAS